MEIYFPREDSELLLKHINRYSKGLALDMGTGSGIQAIEAAKNAKVIAVDANSDAIEYCNKRCKNENIEFRKSNLFSNVKESFDLIIFNPPYLPMDEEDEKNFDSALFGGKKGWELIERFLKEAKKHLNKNGKILLLFSSLTNKKKIDSILKEENYKFKEIDNLKMDFEELYVYEIRI